MKLKVTVEGKTYEVEVEMEEESGGQPSAPSPAAPAPRAAAPAAPAAAPAAAPPPSGGGAGTFPSPLAGTVRAIKVKPGDQVAANDEMMVLEAMKMETSIYASSGGTVKAVLVNVGEQVQSGQALVEFA